MDDPSLPELAHLRALEALARIHRVGRSARLLEAPLMHIARGLKRPVRVLDVATGGADLLMDLAVNDRTASRRSAKGGGDLDRGRFDFSGCDLSEVGLRRGRDAALAAEVPIHLFRFDALSGAAPEGAPYDVVMCSLFLHHLEDEEARSFLRGAKAWATSAVLVHDLVRSRAGWRLAWLASRALTRSPVVRFDALRSVEGAFTPREIMAVADDAGLGGAVCSVRWPARFVLEWRR